MLRTCHSLQRALRRELAPGTLTETGFHLLARLIQQDSKVVTVERLAKDLSLSPQIVSATLGRLEISGIITRERSTDDRRALAIKVSAAGRRTFASALSHYFKAITGVMSALGPRDPRDARSGLRPPFRVVRSGHQLLNTQPFMIHSVIRRFFRPKAGLVALVGVAAVVFVAGCGKSQSVTIASPVALDVTTLAVKTEPVVLSQELPGRISAFRVAEVRARINGIVQKRLFTEGTDVKEGDVLFEIDPAPYEAALDSARASLARSEASLASAQAQAGRFKGLVATNAVSRQNYDDAVASQLTFAADAAAARAAVRTAEINLGYTRVTSPISGRIGRAEVTEGAYVQQSAAILERRRTRLERSL